MQLLEDILIIFNVTAEKQKCYTSGCREWSYRHQWHSQGEHAGQVSRQQLTQHDLPIVPLS